VLSSIWCFLWVMSLSVEFNLALWVMNLSVEFNLALPLGYEFKC